MATAAQAGISFTRQSVNVDQAMIKVSEDGFRSEQEALDFGRTYAHNDKVISFLKEKMDIFGVEIDKYIKGNAKNYHNRQIKHIKRLGAQIKLFSMAIAEASHPTSGAYLYSYSEVVRQ